MSVVVRIPTPLRRLTGGVDSVEAASSNVSECVQVLEARFPGLQERLLNNQGELHRFVNIYVNGEDIRFMQGLATALKQGDEVSIVPAVAGG
jgi:molybdopterin synthase sulfur carrier subunit